MIEIEKKAYLRDSAVLEKIKEIAVYKGFFDKQDTYYGPDQENKINVYQDRVFRLRKENDKQILSFKKKNFLGKTEVNEEYEMDVSTVKKEDLEVFFYYLGYKSFIDKNKKSHIYIIGNKKGYPVTIEHNLIDQLGEFIEIEILAKEASETEKANQVIEELFSEIGIREEDIEHRYYIDLLAGRKK